MSAPMGYKLSLSSKGTAKYPVHPPLHNIPGRERYEDDNKHSCMQKFQSSLFL
jgi:hypothetical protein